MLTMKLRAKAKTPGECCWTMCDGPGDKIYTDGEYKYLACSQAHAEIVAARIPGLKPETRAFFWGK